jgi:aspartyl-tRNA(Asn)/glutamyl-tRNA(Gln) amidotransferase subunit A
MIPLTIENWTLASLSRALRKKEISPVEVTRAYLERIDAFDRKINAFLTLLPEPALKAAYQAERNILKGRMLSPLHGIPFAVKDLFFTRGIRTTCGSKILRNFMPNHDAAVIERLQASGAVLLGKLNMHEFAYGATSVNPHYGPVRNPWDMKRITGGSSGGSAAALVSSFVPLTLGTDTGGSIRIPSALCGCAGLKPTYGRISRYGVYPLCWSLDHPGPMARGSADLAMAMNVLAGYDSRDPSAAPTSVPDYAKGLTEDLKGIRLGVPATYYFERLTPEVRNAVGEAIGTLKRLGAKVRMVSIPHLAAASLSAFILLLAEGAASLEKWHRTRPLDLGDDVRSRLNLGATLMAAQYLKAQRIRRRVRDEFAAIFQKVDAIVTPQLPVTAPLIGQEKVCWGKKTEAVPSALTRFTRIYNLVGIPSLSIPCGFSPSGLPIGLQVAGKAFDEKTVLKVGHAYEVATPWKDLHPSLNE